MIGDLMYVQMQQIDCIVRESGAETKSCFIKDDWPVKHGTFVVV